MILLYHVFFSIHNTHPFSAVKSEDFAEFKTLTLKISANAAASVLHT